MLSPLVASILFAHTSLVWPPRALLRYKFHPGVSRRYSFDMTMKMNSPGGTAPIDVKIGSVLRQTVKSVSRDGSAKIQSVLESKRIRCAALGATNGVGKATTFTMAPTGQISGMKSPSTANPMMPMNLNSLQASNVLPASPVSVGSHWLSNVDMAGMSDINITNRLESFKQAGGHTIATIRATGSFDISKMSGLASRIGSGMKMSGRVNIDATYSFDVTAGFLRSMSSIGAFRIHMSISPHDPKGQSINMVGSQNMQMRQIS